VGPPPPSHSTRTGAGTGDVERGAGIGRRPGRIARAGDARELGPGQGTLQDGGEHHVAEPSAGIVLSFEVPGRRERVEIRRSAKPKGSRLPNPPNGL
jgi:hypothetical protein